MACSRREVRWLPWARLLVAVTLLLACRACTCSMRDDEPPPDRCAPQRSEGGCGAGTPSTRTPGAACPCADDCDGLACRNGRCVCGAAYPVECGAKCCLQGAFCNQDGGCGCPGGAAVCGGECCGSFEVCLDGWCAFACPDGRVACLGACCPSGSGCGVDGCVAPPDAMDDGATDALLGADAGDDASSGGDAPPPLDDAAPPDA